VRTTENRANARILLVDDNDAGRYMMARHLSLAGFQVSEATTGLDGLRLFDAEAPDVVILDVQLPDISGYEVCQRIKHGTGPRVPVIQISATFVSTEDRVRGLDYGADVYLGEPINPDELVAYVDAMVRIRRAEASALAANAQLAAVVQSSADAIYSCDPNGIILTWNPAAERLYGHRPSEIVEKPLSILTTDHAWANAESLKRSLSSEESMNWFQAAHRRGNGEIFQAAVSWSKIRDSSGHLTGLCIIARDITRQLEAEKNLRETAAALSHAEERLRFVVENSPDAVFIQDRELRYIWISQATEPLVKEECLGKTDYELLPDDEETRKLIQLKKRLMSEGRREKLEVTISPKGQLRIFEAVYQPWRDSAGEVIGLAGYARDITERKLAEAERERLLSRLAADRQRIGTILRELPAGVVIAQAPDGRVTYSNKYVEQIFGTGHATSGADNYITTWNPHHPDGRPFDLEEVPMVRALRGEASGGVEMRMPVEQGWVDLSASATPIRDASGAVVEAVVAFENITERKKAEEYASALGVISDMIHSTLNSDEIMQRAIAEAARALGAETAAISLRQASSWRVSYVHGFPSEVIGAEMRDEPEPHALRAITTRKPVAITDTLESEEVNRAHMQRWGIRSVLVVPLLVKGEAAGVLFFNHHHRPFQFQKMHISFASRIADSLSLALENARLFENLQRELIERQEAERSLESAHEALGRAHAEAEQKVKDRTARLEELVLELEGLSYSIAHDMRAPLRAMSSFAQVLVEEYNSRLDDKARDYLRRIAASAQRLDRMIQDVLNYTRLVRHGLPLEPVNLDNLARELISSYPNLQPPSAVISIEGQLPVVHGNVAALTQCFSNLLDNAVKFVTPGVLPQVRLRSEPAGLFARIWFEDNGTGIPSDWHARIFDLFQRYHSSVATKGTGVGLAVVRKSIERMGGRVGLESEPEKGSRFWIELPAVC
jgi:PAS domain S-box-containing protein